MRKVRVTLSSKMSKSQVRNQINRATRQVQQQLLRDLKKLLK